MNAEITQQSYRRGTKWKYDEKIFWPKRELNPRPLAFMASAIITTLSDLKDHIVSSFIYVRKGYIDHSTLGCCNYTQMSGGGTRIVHATLLYTDGTKHLEVEI